MEARVPSSGVLDVFFRNGQAHVAIEVKSALSHEADITRCIFQCVKYRAALEAQQAAGRLPRSARAILVLEAKLPPNFHAMMNILGIEVVDEATPTG